MSESLIVIGNGMAAARFVDELAQRALGRYAVAVIGEEPRLAYNRVLLSALLASRRNVNRRQHEKHADDRVKQDARAVRSPGHDVSPSSKRVCPAARVIEAAARRL